MYTFIQLSLKEIISFQCTGYHYKSQRLIKQCLIVNCVMCVYGKAYEMLNAIFHICSLTAAQVQITLFLDEKYFRHFYCNS